MKGTGENFPELPVVAVPEDNSLALGLMAHVGDAASTAAMARSLPVGRLGTPEDVGAAVVYLASDEASWLTGQTIGLNGGSITS